jgi:Tfp pilus assembly PilM family ATPase
MPQTSPDPPEASPHGEDDFQLHHQEQLEDMNRNTPIAQNKESANGRSAWQTSGTDREAMEHMQRELESLKRIQQELVSQLSRVLRKFWYVTNVASANRVVDSEHISQRSGVIQHSTPTRGFFWGEFRAH